MPIPMPQTAFGGGEVSPSLYGRYDLAKFSIAAKTLLNVFVLAHGGATNRPGFGLCAAATSDTEKSRMITFAFNEDQQYGLEFSPGKIRFFRNGGVIVYPAGDPDEGEIVEVETTYEAEDLPYIKYTGSQDVMTLTCRGHAPRELRRLDHHSWTLSVITFEPTIGPPTDISIAATGSGSTEYKYKIASLKEETLEESIGSAVLTVNNAAALSDTVYNTVTVNTAVHGAVKYAVYKNANGTYGFIGYIDGTTGSLADKNIKATVDDAVQEAANYFTDTNTYPGVTAYHDQRRVFANTLSKPNGVWMSQSANYNNMSAASPAHDSDAIVAAIAGNLQIEIRHMISLNGDLVIMSGSSEWKCTALSSGEIVSPTSIRFRKQGERGCSDVRPIMIGNVLLYVQAKGQIVRDLGYDLNADSYIGNDLSVLSMHLFEGRRIVDWAYCQSPYSVIWVVLDNGKFLSLTYLREHDVWAWCRHETNGFVESVCAVSEGGEDRLYASVRRTINGATKRFVERMASRQFQDIRDAFFVDCGLSYDNPVAISGIATGTETVVTSAGHGLDSGDDVDIADVIGCEIEDDGGNTTSAINNHRHKVEVVDADTFKILDDDGNPVSSEEWSTYYSGGVWRLVVTQISGADHLNGAEGVRVLADGAVYGVDDPVVISEGVVPLQYPASRVHVGLGYISEIELLPLGDGNSQHRLKRVVELRARVENTRGISGGSNRKNLMPIRERYDETYGSPTDPYTGMVVISINPEWGYDGAAIIQQENPLPMTILNVVPIVNVGG